MIHHTGVILSHFPNARLVYLVRDPRDVAASSKKSVFNPYCPRFTATLWEQQQAVGRQLLRSLPPATIQLVRYEDLVRKPAATLDQLCQFLNEPFERELLRFFNTEEAKKSSRLSASWKNTGKPIQSTSVGRYGAELSRRELLHVECHAHRSMEFFGYSPVHDEETLQQAAACPTCSDHLKDILLRFRVEWWSLLRDRNHWRRWGRAMLLYYLRLRLRLTHAALR